MMTLLCITGEQLGAILSGIAALIVALISLITFLAQRRDKKQLASEAEHKHLLQNISKENLQQSRKLTEISNDMEELHDSINDISTKVDTNERDRLRWQIRNFARELRREPDYIPELNEFEEIENDFERYESLGGNGFIKNEMKFIMLKKEEFYNN